MMKRLFVGVPVSEEIKSELEPAIQKIKETGADLTFVSLENLHFTLKFLGDIEESKIAEINEKLSSFFAQQRKFTLLLEKVGVFPSKELIKVVWIGLSGQEIVHLIQKIEQLLRYLRAEEHQEIVPHLTLARVKSGKNKLQLQEALAQLENSSFGTLPVDKVFLYESRLTPQGPVYNLLQEFDLK